MEVIDFYRHVAACRDITKEYMQTKDIALLLEFRKHVLLIDDELERITKAKKDDWKQGYRD